MNTVGLFAGRGDVVLAMGIAFILGMLTGFISQLSGIKLKRGGIHERKNNEI